MSTTPVDAAREQHLSRLDQRCKWLTARIAAKRSVGWETIYDESERDALAWALAQLNGAGDLKSRRIR